ncbi:helix-turn-helix domain-containing protein [Candidatus Poribacteria bacterium]|nr:helix-turn-helix domain-containing protein [Candidatus Poribacteria bacterium]
MSDVWLALSEAASLVQEQFAREGRTISRKTVSRWASDGKVSAARRGSRWFIERESLLKYLGELLAGSVDVTPAQPEPANRLREQIARRNAQFLRDLEAGID